MRVFITGASGSIGSAVSDELLAHDHQVVGLARSDEATAALDAKGVAVARGDLDDLASLRDGAVDADAVIHLAFKHDFTDYAGAGRTERAAVQTLLDTLEGSDRPFLMASGLAFLAQGRPATEHDAAPAGPDAPRGGAEALALSYAARGVRAVGLRFAASVHGTGDHGFVARLFEIAQERGVSGYIGDGTNRWPAVHRSDAARMVRLALEKAPAGSVVHGVGEEGIATRDIAAAIGVQLGIPAVSVAPEDAAGHFGWLARLFGLDARASSRITQELLGWTPVGPTLLEDVAAGAYAGAVAA